MTISEARADGIIIGTAGDVGYLPGGVVDPGLPIAWRAGRPETWEPIDDADGRTLTTLDDVRAALDDAGPPYLCRGCQCYAARRPGHLCRPCARWMDTGGLQGGDDAA